MSLVPVYDSCMKNPFCRCCVSKYLQPSVIPSAQPLPTIPQLYALLSIDATVSFTLKWNLRSDCCEHFSQRPWWYRRCHICLRHIQVGQTEIGLFRVWALLMANRLTSVSNWLFHLLHSCIIDKDRACIAEPLCLANGKSEFFQAP